MLQEQIEKSKIGAHQPNISLKDSLSISFLQDHVRLSSDNRYYILIVAIDVHSWPNWRWSFKKPER